MDRPDWRGVVREERVLVVSSKGQRERNCEIAKHTMKIYYFRVGRFCTICLTFLINSLPLYGELLVSRPPREGKMGTGGNVVGRRGISKLCIKFPFKRVINFLFRSSFSLPGHTRPTKAQTGINAKGKTIRRRLFGSRPFPPWWLLAI